MDANDSSASPTRRRFFRTLGAIPVAVAALPGCSDRPAHGVPSTPGAPTQEAKTPYRATFFHPDEWAFIVAAADRLIPSDDVGPGAVELGVPEFLDRHMNTPYAAGDIWYMQGPFVEAGKEFGYQGPLPLRDILRVGIKAFDTYCRQHHDGKAFADLDRELQNKLLSDADNAKITFPDIPAKAFFDYFLNEVRYGYFADPSYGGNRDMGAWKAIAYPGVRAEFLDWVTVRDKPYPLGPVDLSGRRASA